MKKRKTAQQTRNEIKKKADKVRLAAAKQNYDKFERLREKKRT